MEDAHTHLLTLPGDKDASFFGVFDGHGGKLCAYMCVCVCVCGGGCYHPLCVCVCACVHVCEKGQRVDCECMMWKGEGLCLQVLTIRRKGGESVQYFCLFVFTLYGLRTMYTEVKQMPLLIP